jgi:hypothetical protein
MKKTLVIAALIFGLTAVASAVDLYPTRNVSAEWRLTAVVSICAVTGYAEYDVDGNEIAPAIVYDAQGKVTSCAWTDQAAMWSHYEEAIFDELRKWHRIAQERNRAPVPELEVE